MAVGTGISAAGMSMHMKSKPVRLVTRRKVPKEKYALLGRRVATHCTEDSDLPCSVAGQFDSSNDVYLRNAFETFRTLKNELSRVHDIQDHDAGPEGRHTYIKKADIPSGADYEAVTYSITTTCSVIKKQCLIQPSMDPNMYESCIRPPIFDEMTGNKRFQLLMSADSAGYRKAHPSNLTNPYYLAVRASRGTLRGGSDSGAQSRASITDQADSGEDVINLWCGVTVHDVSYASTNNTIVNWSSKPVNATLARIFAAPSFSDLSTALLGEEMRATYARTPDEIDLCKSLSRFYSWTAVAFVAGTMEEVVSIHEWRRVESSGTKLPHSILKTLYAFVGILTGISILLVILAVFAARKHNGRWFEVKMLLSVEGAVAQALRETGGESREQLECVWDMYEERTAPDEEAVVVEKKKKWVEVKVEDDHGKMVPKWEVKPAVKGKKEGCSCGGGGEVWVVPTQDGEGDGGMGDR
ncbi:hypothetical protein DFH27DRAFT_527830 [Peziza echinospora]|nr:hypothetical protein DFH27DRAFT_527830 [Peziza echinospora]